MPSLAELQASFAGYLLAPLDRTAPPALPGAVTRNGASAEERLAIYKNNAHARLIDALAASFPAVEKLVGTEFFRYAAQIYIAKHTPRSPVLLDYGDRFPDFLARFAPATTVAYLPDVARLELLYLEAYHARERESIAAEAFAAALADPAAAPPLGLHPSARLMESRHPVSRIWELNRLSEFPAGKQQIPGESEQLLIIRPQATVEVRRVGRGAYAALSALANQAGLAEALAAGMRAEPAANLGQHLAALSAGQSFCLREER
jgi:hypothetical protein